MMLNWPTIWDSSQVEQRCQQHKECGKSTALSCTCTQCGRRLYTNANTDIFAPDSPDWVASEGWYAVCDCGQLEQWTLRQATKSLMIMEKIFFFENGTCEESQCESPDCIIKAKSLTIG